MKTLEEERKIAVDHVKEESKERFKKCLDRIKNTHNDGIKEIVFLPGDGTKQVLVYGNGMAILELRDLKDNVVRSKILTEEVVRPYMTGEDKTFFFTNHLGNYTLNKDENWKEIIKECGTNNGIRPKYRHLIVK